jgi:hypothetical protein
MNFRNAINLVVYDNQTVTRKGFQHPHSYDGNDDPWSEWIRIRVEDDLVDREALIFIETNSYDDVNQKWFSSEWREDNLNKEDVLADDWELVKEE